MKKFMLFVLAAVAACSWSQETQKWDRETGQKVLDEKFKGEFNPLPVSVQAGKVGVHIGTARVDGSELTAELYDSNGDGVPDLARTSDGKMYALTEVRRVQRSSVPDDTRVIRLVGQRPSVLLPNDPPADGKTLLAKLGLDEVTEAMQRGETVFRHNQRSLLFEFIAQPNLLDSRVRMALRVSSQWKMPSMAESPAIRYEILGTDSASGPELLLYHIEGRLEDVIRFHVAAGTLSMAFYGFGSPLSWNYDPVTKTVLVEFQGQTTTVWL